MMQDIVAVCCVICTPQGASQQAGRVLGGRPLTWQCIRHPAKSVAPDPAQLQRLPVTAGALPVQGI